eukprot:3492631-Rhodomonas_salina.2
MKSELLDKNPPSCPEGTPQYRTTTEVWPTPLLSLPSLWLAARGGDDASALGVDSMAGTFVFSSVVMILGLLIHIVEVHPSPGQTHPQRCVLVTVLSRKDRAADAQENEGEEIEPQNDSEGREAPTLRPPPFYKPERGPDTPEDEGDEARISPHLCFPRTSHVVRAADMAHGDRTGSLELRMEARLGAIEH